MLSVYAPSDRDKALFVCLAMYFSLATLVPAGLMGAEGGVTVHSTAVETAPHGSPPPGTPRPKEREICPASKPADAPGEAQVPRPKLSEDDALLLLMGGASPETKAELIRARGIDSDWGNDFRERLSALCLEDDVRAALGQECQQTRTLGGSAPVSPCSDLPFGQTLTIGTNLLRGSEFEPVVLGISIQACTQKGLPTPDEPALRRIVERLTDNDARLENLLKNYTFHASILARSMDGGGAIRGSFYGEWDVMFSDRGKRFCRAVTNSADTIGQSVKLLRSSKIEPHRPLMFLPEDRADYTFRYVEHVTLDEVSVYKLVVEPKTVEKGRTYFRGVLWVEDRSIQIVKAEGDRVPSFQRGAFGWQFYPHYVTFRSQNDGRFWLPTFTVADGVANGIRVNLFTKYFNYRRFGAQVVLHPALGDKDPDPLMEPAYSQ